MRRIDDLSSFHAVKESGLAKLMPPVPQVPMPTAMRGRLGSSLARPASLTALNEEMSCMRISLPVVALQGLHLAVQGLFVHVAVDGVIHFHNRRQGALSETRNRA